MVLFACFLSSYNGIILYIYFYKHQALFVHVIHGVVCSLLNFIAIEYFIIWIYQFIYMCYEWWAEDCFWFFAVTNNAAYEHSYTCLLCMCRTLEYISWRRRRIWAFSALLGNAKLFCFLKWSYQLTLPSAMYKCFCCPASLPVLGIVCLFNF